MAIDTKPNLSCEKFEQLSGDTLYLSGNTCILGKYVIASGGTFQILSSPSVGKVLTSDSEGCATWQNPTGGGIGWSNLTKGSTVAGCGTPPSGGTLCCNTLYGVCAGAGLTTGFENVGIGVCALRNTNIGRSNIAIGLEPLFNNTCGEFNIGIGYYPLYSNISGCSNIAMGTSSMCYNTIGSHNIALGWSSLFSNTCGNNNIALGQCTLRSNTSGINNIALGLSSLYSNISGQNNIGLGFNTLNSNTTANYNIALGYQALCLNTIGDANIAIGINSMLNNIDGYDNIGIGVQALRDAASGNENVAIGSQALIRTSGGSYNVGVGRQALCNNRSGNQNTAIGNNTLTDNTSGTNNTAVGVVSLFSNTTGGFNVAVGSGALLYNTTGSNNVGVGWYAGFSGTTGSDNVFLGACAGYSETGSCKLYIANNANRTLIYGEFDNEKLCIRGKTYISGLTNATTSNVIYYDSSTKELSYGTAPSGSGSTSASGERISKLVSQTSHGFNVGNVIGWSGGTYNKAIADGTYDGEVIGIVSKCYNANCFDLTQAGYVTGLTGLTTSCTYFLSDTVAGSISTIEPTGNTHISKAVLLATSTSTGWILPYAGYVVSTGSTGATGIQYACNGLTADGTTVWLGGTLSQATSIFLGSNSFDISQGTYCMYLDALADYFQLNTAGSYGDGLKICGGAVHCAHLYTTGNTQHVTLNKSLDLATISSCGVARIDVWGGCSAVKITGNAFLSTSPNTGTPSDSLLIIDSLTGEIKQIVASGITSGITSGIGWSNMDTASVVAGCCTPPVTTNISVFNSNTIYGVCAGVGSTGTTGNVAIGYSALKSTSGGDYNVAIGTLALDSNTMGNYNIAIGATVMDKNTRGDNNIAIGTGALACNLCSCHNIAIGNQALRNTTGYTAGGVYADNVAIGNSAMYCNVAGYRNVAIGSTALYYSNTYGNVAVGFEALGSQTTGCRNTAVGLSALRSNTSGQENTAVGDGAMLNKTSGNENTVIGHATLYNNADGANNTIIGSCAMYGSSTGSNNTVVGFLAGYGNTGGSCNVFLGSYAGYSETGSSKLHISNCNVCSLICGDFLLKSVKIHGCLAITNLPAKSTETCGVWIDSFGNLSYGVISGGTGSGTITGGTNGLGANGADICLGGILTNTTVISGNSQTLNLGTIASCLGTFDVRSTNMAICGGVININGATSADINGGNIRFQLDNSCGVITDNSGNGKGLQYALDYSNTFVDESLVSKKYVDSKLSGSTLNVFTITGDGTTTGFTVNHNFNQQYVGVEIVENTSPYPTVYTDVSRPTANDVCVTFDTAPLSGATYKVLIIMSGGSGGGAYATLDAAINSVSSASYTLASTDRGKVIEFTNTGATAIWLPTGLTTGFQAVLVNIGGDNKTLCACTNATLNTLNSNVIIAGAYNSASVYNRGTNNWVGFGNLS